MSSGRIYSYSVFGITLASEFEFPELAPGGGTPELRVRRGSSSGDLHEWKRPGSFFEATPEGFVLCVAGLARVSVSAGRDVVIDPTPEASEPEIRTLFLGLVLTGILHQRGVLVLHASGVVCSRGAILIAGHSGDGKSTLLAALARRGYDPFGDDAAAVTQNVDGSLFVQPGFPQARL